MRTPADNLTHAATARACQWLVVALIASTFGLSPETHDKIVIQGIHGFANGESYLEETARYQDRFEYLGRVAGTFAVWRDRTDHLRFTLAYLEGYKPIPRMPLEFDVNLTDVVLTLVNESGEQLINVDADDGLDQTVARKLAEEIVIATRDWVGDHPGELIR